MTMLENGKHPRIFGWKDALLAHLNHEEEVYRKAYEYDLIIAQARLHIVEGILKALAQIEEVISTIKQSSSSTNARTNLMKEFGFSDLQATAILEIKLVRLANLEIEKFLKEKEELITKIAEIEEILSNKELLYKEIENGLRTVMKKFGDKRRTKVLNLNFTNEDDEPIEKKALMVNLTNWGNIYASDTSTLMTQRRGGVGNKFKLQDGEYITDTVTDTNYGTALFFSDKGRFFSYNLSNLIVNEKVNVGAFLSLGENETIKNLVSLNKKQNKKYIVFITEQGLIKKSLLSEYNTKRVIGVQAIKLNKGDAIAQILFINDEPISLITEQGQCIRFTTTDINPIGRLTTGVKSIKLSEGDKVATAQIAPKGTKEFISISKNGFIKRTSISEVSLTGRNVKGTRLQKLKDGTDKIVSFLPIVDEPHIIVIANNSSIKMSILDIPLSSKNAMGAKAIKLKANAKVISLVRNL